MEITIFFFRIFLTFLLALIFGLERQKTHKPAGVGTFTFVAVGACSLLLIAVDIGGMNNSLLLIGSILTGIGFLGAGALIKTSDKIFGFTTAASIWVFSIFGILMGLGYYLNALILYAFIWICIFIDRYLEIKGTGTYEKKIHISLGDVKDEKEITKVFTDFNIKRQNLLSKTVNKNKKLLLVSYLLEGSGKDIRRMLERIQKIPSFQELSFG